ncbi:fimbrial protein [Proteus sp. GOKU]|jgi:Mat/Ecp fimbriae major subunit|uniref:common pilus major fimbrillin subunit EcpA n=1 Tax=Proteus TaxID=583 RepID=UPI0018928FCF|nr:MULTISPECIES: common pilus major fimbrillin subunit EcpA [Proteus]QPB80789.1 fimbrial protein [Proteus sp. GOKU]QQP26796.1 fimbrial protein [Proteus vulgaris]WPC98575.1 common pilus major fimbrillin subunit EcpA [Proteus terrae]
MKKLTLAVLAVAIMGATTLAQADTRKASAVASWDAKAYKDTKSMLVVTPLKSLTFYYAEGIKAFNSQDGAFDITIQGQENATDFKLTSKIITDKLVRTSDNSELTVGVKWNGTDLTSSTDTTMVDVATGATAGLDFLAQDGAYNGKERVSGQSQFTFNIASAKIAGTDAQFSDLADGYWDGDVKVQFTATWEGDFTKGP